MKKKKLVIIFGPQAVGKMTVGEELEKQTGLKLFHNHMTIDLVSKFFSYGTSEGKRLVQLFRKEIFEAVAKSDLYGMIFTFVWALNMKEDWDYIANITELFEKHGADIYYVELSATLEKRLLRNKTENRLAKKLTKRDISWTEKDILDSIEKYRLNSNESEIKFNNYIKIDNTNLEPNEVAKLIKEKFDL